MLKTSSPVVTSYVTGLNIQKFYDLLPEWIFVLFVDLTCQNTQWLFPYTALTYWVYTGDEMCLLNL